jgi:predicted TIM-barrel fold metal-dependent hydrolase
VVHVHPAVAPGNNALLPGVSASTLEYAFDTTRTIVSLLYHGTPQRYPRVKLVFSHAGGALPYLAGRVASFSELNPRFAQKGIAGVIPAVRSFHYDVTDSVNPYTFGALLKLVPATQLLFGSDIPFAAEPRIRAATRGLAELGLAPDVLQAIEQPPALRLFPRLRPEGGPASGHL